MVQARFVFGVLNLPLREELVCGPFTLVPIPDGQEELKKRKGMDTESVWSADGVLPLPEDISLRDPWSYIDEQPLQAMQLLLSLAERRFVEIIEPQVQKFVDGEWRFSNGRFHLPQYGNPHGTSWHHGHAHLQEFVNQCLPIVADPERGEKQGLRLALQFYRTNFRDDFVELQYLKSWLALETLYSQHIGSTTIMGSSRFRRISKAIKMLLSNCQAKGFIEEHEQLLMQEKLGEINRLSARVQALQFFENIFQNYPALAVTEEDMRTFVRIRNDITHRGLMTHDGEDDYGDVLHDQHMRLQSLLERVFLAVMGQDANLMTFSWTHWRAPR